MANIAEHADKSIVERYRFNHAVVEFLFVFVFSLFEEEKPIRPRHKIAPNTPLNFG
jgi:hypothetical protein